MKDKIEFLRQKGVVLTIQRLAVLRYLQGNKDHPTAEEIHRALRPHYPTLSLATVYNTLDTLKQAGLISELNLGKEKRFDPRGDWHHHFYCRVCGRIYDVSVQCPLAKEGRLDGHRVETIQAIFTGCCAACVATEEQGEAARAPYRCVVCGWVYDPLKGDGSPAAPAGTPFARLPESWCCKVCGAPRGKFVPVETALLQKRSVQREPR